MHLDEESEEPKKSTPNGVVVHTLTHINLPGVVVENGENGENKTINSLPSGIKPSKWKVVKESTNVLVPRGSRGDIKLNSLIAELKKFSLDESSKAEQIAINNSWNWVKISRRRLEKLLHNPKFHYFIIVLVIIDLIVVLVDLILAIYSFYINKIKSVF